MGAPIGVGAWIAFINEFAGGIDEAIAKLKAIGVSWVAPRASENGIFGAGFKLEHIAKYKAAGFGVFPWDFTRPKTWRSSVAACIALIRAGADGFLIDAEQSWDVDVNGTADGVAFMTALRAQCPIGQVWIGDAPWPYEGVHPSFPLAPFAIAGGGVDAHLPQAYATEIGTTVPKCLAEMDREWSAWEAKHPNAVRPRWPILSTYTKTSKFIVQDVLDALDAYSGQPISLYSLEAMDRKLFDALVIRAQRCSTLPAPPQFDPFTHAATTLADDIHDLTLGEKPEGEE